MSTPVITPPAAPTKKPKDEMGHTPTKNGLWIVCNDCHMTKRRAGWWKPCPGPQPSRKYMGE